MPMGRPKAELMLSADEEAPLKSFVRSRSLPAALSLRAKLILACAAGAPNSEVAPRLDVTNAAVGKWRRRFIERRINGLYDELQPSKPRTIGEVFVRKRRQRCSHCSGVGACEIANKSN